MAPVRLAVNAGPDWADSDCALAAPRHATEVIILSGSDEGHQLAEQAATETASATGTEPPNCRGPPSLEQGRRRVGVRAERGAPAPETSPDGDLTVVDDLGHPVPVCAAELNVMETYLSGVLDELLVSSKASSEPEQA
jgi:hypothetical protein